MNSTSIIIRRPVRLSLLAVLALSTLAGCARKDEPLTRHEQVLSNLTPELRTLYQRNVDVANMFAHTDNTNKRAMYWDIYRALYRDRPSRLHPIPRPY